MLHRTGSSVAELLQRGAAVNARASDSATPLMRACAEGHLAAATLLLDAGADLPLLCNNVHSALQLTKRRARVDKAPKLPEHREHKALFKKRGAV